MTLRTICDHCGVKFKAKEEYLGRTLTCPKCQKPFVVKPQSGGAVEPRRTQAATTKAVDASSCPNCSAAIGAGAVLCVECGYHLKLGRKLQASHEAHDETEKRDYLGRLVDASPGSGELMRQSGMETELSALTIPGWCLAIFTLVVAGSAVIAPLLIFTSSGNRTSGGLARAVGIPIALVVGGITFWAGKRILSALNLPLTRDG